VLDGDHMSSTAVEKDLSYKKTKVHVCSLWKIILEHAPVVSKYEEYLKVS